MSSAPVELDRARGSFLALAAGDALGWPQEGRWRLGRSSDRTVTPQMEFMGWKRRSGGRFQGFEETVRPGEYSDDTQLMLAVARSRVGHGDHWHQALTKWELPFWTLYERGGGGATKAAARTWSKGVPPWKSERPASHRYFQAGGNGVAMRVLPHALFLAHHHDPAELLNDVVADGITTHGHPRALVGATLYAFSAWWLARRRKTLAFGELLEVLLDEGTKWSAFPAHTLDAFPGWLDAANRAGRSAYERVWNRTVDEARVLLTTARNGIKQGAMADDRAVLGSLDCFGRSNGAGTVCAAAVSYLLARHAAQPQQAILRAAFERGADTDTLAAMVGGLAGCLAGTDWIPSPWLAVQDANYLEKMASRIAGAPTQSDHEPVRQFDPREVERQFSVLERTGTGTVRLGALLMDATPLASPRPIARSIKVQAWRLKTADGQTLYVNQIRRAAPAGRQFSLESSRDRRPLRPEGQPRRPQRQDVPALKNSTAASQASTTPVAARERDATQEPHMSADIRPERQTPSESTPEIGALKAAIEVLDPLEAESRRRILTYVNDLYGFSKKQGMPDPTPMREGAARTDAVDSRQHSDFPDLFEAGGNPTAEKPRALLAAYWLQVIQGKHPFLGARSQPSASSFRTCYDQDFSADQRTQVEFSKPHD